MALYFLFIKFRNDRKSVNFFSILPSVSRVNPRDVTRFKVGYLPNTEHEGIACIILLKSLFSLSFFFLAWISVLSKHLWIFLLFPLFKIKQKLC